LDIEALEEGRKVQTISALPPRGYMISNGSLTRDVNHDLPQEERRTEWTENEQHIIRAVQVETGCDRPTAIRALVRRDAVTVGRTFCADTSGGDFHFLPLGARKTKVVCGPDCRGQLESSQKAA
jgi:hypothetical protein